MKNVIKVLLGALVVVSCQTDPCKNVVCGTNGSCTEGVCICETGYEKDANNLCNVVMRDKFLGTYASNETCTASSSPYTNTITVSSEGIDRINISNFYGYANNLVKGTVDGSSVTIPLQTTPDNFEVSGTGSITSGSPAVLSISFLIKDLSATTGATTDTCTVVMTKQ